MLLVAHSNLKTSIEAKKIISNNFNFMDGLVGLGPFNLEPGQVTDDTEMSLAKYGSYC